MQSIIETKTLLVLASVLLVLFLVPVVSSGEGVYHLADINQDGVISRAELDRVIEMKQSDGYHCDADSVSGYAPGVDTSAQDCQPHDSDYNPQNWQISNSELLRLIQIFNVGGYVYCPTAGTEDGFCPQAPDNGGNGNGGDLAPEVSINQSVFNVNSTAIINVSVSGGEGPYTVQMLTPFGSRFSSGGSGPSFVFEDWLFYHTGGQEADFVIRVTDSLGERTVIRQTVRINR